MKATPKQWGEAGSFASDTRACLLELRARVEALEVGVTAAPPASSLVERMQQAIHDIEFPHGTDEARAAIREVAAWLRAGRMLHAAELLEQEVDR